MTILTVIQNACAEGLGLEVPDVVFTSTDRDMIEMQRIANEMARRIADAFDWQKLKKIATITGDGSTEDWSLPSDYKRQLKKATLWSSSLETGLTHIQDTDRWLELDVQSFYFVINAWTIYGNEIHVKPALDSGVTAKYFYIRNTVVQASGGTLKTSFTADTDTYELDEDLLKLGITWKWKDAKGLPSESALEDYEELKERLIVADGGSKRVAIGQPRLRGDARIAYPVNITP